MTSLTFDAALFAAVAVAVTGDETRFYLRGVYIEPMPSGYVHLTATDGHMLLTAQALCQPEETIQPFIIAISKQTDDILKACRASKACLITLDLSSHLWTTRDEHGGELSVGRWSSVDGSFPDYRRIFPKKPKQSPDAVSFAPALLSRFTDAGKRLGTKRINLEPCGSNDPSVVTFGENSNIVGLLMPMRAKEKDSVTEGSFEWVHTL